MGRTVALLLALALTAGCSSVDRIRVFPKGRKPEVQLDSAYVGATVAPRSTANFQDAAGGTIAAVELEPRPGLEQIEVSHLWLRRLDGELYGIGSVSPWRPLTPDGENHWRVQEREVFNGEPLTCEFRFRKTP